jgi:Raffinose synthase or seed imbibition protein Sip1
MNIYLPERIVDWPQVPQEKEKDPNEMYAKIICHPPLGQATTVPAGPVTFNAILETETNAKPFELSLWFNKNGEGAEWDGIPFEETQDATALLSLSSEKNPKTRRLFAVTLPENPTKGVPLRFTIKFRQGSASNWKWVSEQLSLSDGVIHYQSGPPEGGISDFIESISPAFKATPVAADTDDTLLWSLEAPVGAANGGASGYTSHRLGLPKSFTRWFATVRLWNPWIAPRHGQDKFKIDKDALVCAFLRQDGLSVVVLAVSGIDDVLTLFRSAPDGAVLVNSRNDAEEQGLARVIVAVAESFEVANAAAMYHARRMVMSASEAYGEISKEVSTLKESESKPEWFEEWADGFAYCTWNGLGQALTEDKIFRALDSLEKNDIKITNLIIDDNWQSLDNEGQNQSFRGMTRFEANEAGFPNGLGDTCYKIRQQHPSILHIAVWHAMMGYWGAISPTGQLAKDYKTVQAAKPGGGTWTCIDPEDVSRFYNDFYQFLSNSYVDGVKTDAQFMLDDLQAPKDRRTMIRAYQDAWTIANLRHLGARAISCMSQAPQIIFHSQLPTNKPRLLVRNSDDFFPDIESSHAWHVFANAHNSLLTQHLNALPDWDMFQTVHDWAAFHAAARCVSGGPIYFTDVPGQHDVGLIKQMTAKTPRGNTVILRPHRVGKSSNAYVGYEERRLLKVDTFVGMQSTGVGIVGVFNVCQRSLSEIMHLAEFPGTEEGTYIVRSHVSGKISAPYTRHDKSPIVGIDLGVRGYDILSAYPLQSFKRKSGDIAVTNLGLIGKMSGAAAIVNTDIYEEDSGRLRIWTSLKALGTYGMFTSAPISG